MCLLVVIHNLKLCLYSRTCATGPSLFSQLLSEEQLGVSLYWAELCHALLEGLICHASCSFFPPPSFGVSGRWKSSSVFCVLCFLASGLLVCCCFCMLSCFHLPETKHWCVCVCVWQYLVYKRVCFSWFLRLLLLLSSISHLCSLTLRNCSCVVTDLGSWSSYLLSYPFWCSLSLNSLVQSFWRLLHDAPHSLKVPPRKYYFHSSWSLAGCHFLNGVDLVPCEISPGCCSLTVHLYPLQHSGSLLTSMAR